MIPKGEIRPWGHFETIYENDRTWTKILFINPGQSLSLQYHDYRKEIWYPLDKGATAIIGDKVLDLQVWTCYCVPRQTPHRIINDTDAQLRVLEVAVGAVDEKDIVRLSDKYGRIDR